MQGREKAREFEMRGQWCQPASPQGQDGRLQKVDEHGARRYTAVDVFGVVELLCRFGRCQFWCFAE